MPIGPNPHENTELCPNDSEIDCNFGVRDIETEFKQHFGPMTHRTQLGKESLNLDYYYYFHAIQVQKWNSYANYQF